MSDIRKQLVEKQALDDMSWNAEVTDIYCNYKPQLRIVGKYSNGGMILGGSKYPHKGTNTINISKLEAKTLLDSNDRVEWVNDKWFELNNDYSFRNFSPNCSVYIDIIAIVGYDIEYHNGREISISEEFNINSKHNSQLARSGIDSEIKIVSETDENITILTKFGEESEYNNKNIKSKSDKLSNLILQYISRNKKWIEGTFGDFVEKDDKLIVPLTIDSTTYELKFRPPFNDENKIWKLTDEFGYDDPWNLQRERFNISIHSSTRNFYRNNFIHLKHPESDILKPSLLERIKKKIISYK